MYFPHVWWLSLTRCTVQLCTYSWLSECIHIQVRASLTGERSPRICTVVMIGQTKINVVAGRTSAVKIYDYRTSLVKLYAGVCGHIIRWQHGCGEDTRWQMRVNRYKARMLVDVYKYMQQIYGYWYISRWSCSKISSQIDISRSSINCWLIRVYITQ
jgi:hypothetical protein